MPKKIFVVFLFALLTTQVTFADTEGSGFCFQGTKPEDIQTFLKDKFGLNLKVSKIFDVQTRNALRVFQYSYGMKATGSLDIPTVNKLREIGKCVEPKKYILDGFPTSYFASSTQLFINTVTVTVGNNQDIINPRNLKQIQDSIVRSLLDYQAKGL
jgi:peptidoglycan hydrolase-like protein with peptidoglycan-binding domain